MSAVLPDRVAVYGAGTFRRGIVDDLLATGGTAAAGIRLCERLGAGVVGCAFVIDLPDLGGRALLEGMGYDVHALTAFEGD